MNAISQNKRELVLAGAAALVSAMLIVLVALPQRDASHSRKARLKALDSDIQRSTVAVDAMTELIRSREAQADPVVRSAEELLPRLLEQISRKGRRHGVEVVKMSPGRPERIELHDDGAGESAVSVRLRVSVLARARYRNFGEYLDSLEDLPLLVAVRNLKITQENARSAVILGAFDIETFAVEARNEKAE